MKITLAIIASLFSLNLHASIETDLAANFFTKIGEDSYHQTIKTDGAEEMPTSMHAPYNKVVVNLETVKTTKDEAIGIIKKDLEELNTKGSPNYIACRDSNNKAMKNLENLESDSSTFNHSFEFTGEMPSCNKKKCAFKSEKLVREYSCKLNITAKTGNAIKLQRFVRHFGQNRELARVDCERVASLVAQTNDDAFNFYLAGFYPRSGGILDPVPTEYRCVILPFIITK